MAGLGIPYAEAVVDDLLGLYRVCPVCGEHVVEDTDATGEQTTNRYAEHYAALHDEARGPDRVCPRGGEVLHRTLDENSGTWRFRCEEHDVEECPDCGAWTAYDDEHEWYHLVPGTPACFLHPAAPDAETLAEARGNDAYPYSCVLVDGRRLCPICDAAVVASVYAIHWEAAHPTHSRVLRSLEWNVPLLDAWYGQGCPLPDDPDHEPAEEPAEVVLTEAEIVRAAETWTDTHDTFTDAVLDLIAAKRDGLR